MVRLDDDAFFEYVEASAREIFDEERLEERQALFDIFYQDFMEYTPSGFDERVAERLIELFDKAGKGRESYGLSIGLALLGSEKYGDGSRSFKSILDMVSGRLEN